VQLTYSVPPLLAPNPFLLPLKLLNLKS
jgi:hypothetical protein